MLRSLEMFSMFIYSSSVAISNRLDYKNARTTTKCFLHFSHFLKVFHSQPTL